MVEFPAAGGVWGGIYAGFAYVWIGSFCAFLAVEFVEFVAGVVCGFPDG